MRGNSFNESPNTLAPWKVMLCCTSCIHSHIQKSSVPRKHEKTMSKTCNAQLSLDCFLSCSSVMGFQESRSLCTEQIYLKLLFQSLQCIYLEMHHVHLIKDTQVTPFCESSVHCGSFSPKFQMFPINKRIKTQEH